jgi:hypothetical protein
MASNPQTCQLTKLQTADPTVPGAWPCVWVPGKSCWVKQSSPDCCCFKAQLPSAAPGGHIRCTYRILLRRRGAPLQLRSSSEILQRCWLYTLFVCNIIMGILRRFQFIQISQYRAYTQCPALCLQYTARYPQPGGHVCRVDLSREDTANFPSMCAHKEFSHTYLYFYYL